MPTSLPLLDQDVIACCTPLTEGNLAVDEAEAIAQLFKALADPARVRLVSLIAATSAGEACICDLTEPIGLSQGTVSHHMKVLCDAGLLSREQRGKWAYYRIRPDTLSAMAATLRPARD